MSQQLPRRRGWRNDYRNDMPVTEAWTKDVMSWLGDLRRRLRRAGRLPVIVAWPDYPSKKTTLHKIAAHLGFRLTNKQLSHPEVILYFEDRTHGSSRALQEHYSGRLVLNAGCTDISKQHVDRIHRSVFGYSTIIDPTVYTGKAVQKSDANALHDGRIIDCPVPVAEAGSVYQVVIDNDAGNGEVMDYRTPVIGGRIPLVYKKFKSHTVRFTNDVNRSELHSTSDIFSEEEQQRIADFARAMQAEFCELDILRNATDGKIYIIDVNKTPYGPPAHLPAAAREKAIRLLAEAFAQLIGEA